MLNLGIKVGASGPQSAYAIELHDLDADRGAPALAIATTERPFRSPAGAPAGDDLAAAIRRVVTGDDPDYDDMTDLGDHLWTLLFPGPVQKIFTERFELAVDQGRTLRVLLELDSPELAVIPWEMLRWNGMHVFAREDMAFARAPLTPERPAMSADAPLRVLVVIGDPGQAAALEVDKELIAIERAFAAAPGRGHVEVVNGPTKPALADKVRAIRPHVLHFIGHGLIDANGNAALEFNPRGNARWLLDQDDVANALPVVPGVVVLTACRTDAGAHDEVTRSLSAAFLRHPRVAATICMHGDIASKAAATFTAGLYQALAVGEPIDVAAARGRLNIVAAEQGPHTRDRCLPCLTLSTPPSALVTRPAGAVELLPRAEMQAFVDRSEERRLLWSAMTPLMVGTPASQLLIVQGAGQVGKTLVALSAALTCRARGVRVRYVDLWNGSDRVSWLKALRMIRGCNIDAADAPVCQPLDQQVFSWFHASVAAAQRGDPPPVETPAAFVADNDEKITAVSERTPDHIATVFVRFREALAAVAGDNGLVVVLDHLIFGEGQLELLTEKLIAPIAHGDVPGVRLVIVGTEQELKPLGAGLLAAAPRISIDDPPAADFGRLAQLYGYMCGLDEQRSQKLAELVDPIVNQGAPRLPLRLLKVLLPVALISPLAGLP